MAVVAFNILSTVKAALKAGHGAGKIEAGLSDFYLVEEVQGTFRGMMIALPPPLWQPWADLSVTNFADTLKQWADKVDLKRFASSPRGPKKPKTKGEATLPEPNSHIDVRHPPSNGFALPYSLLAPAQTFPTHAHRHWETIRQFGKLRSCTL